MRCKVTVPATDSSGSTIYGACNQDEPCADHPDGMPAAAVVGAHGPETIIPFEIAGDALRETADIPAGEARELPVSPVGVGDPVERCRRFQLRRLADVSGVSGVGVVSVGVQFPTGRCVLEWLPSEFANVRSIGVYANLDEVNAVHGHGGATVIEWLDAGE